MLAQNYRRRFLTSLISFEKENNEIKNKENLVYRITRIYMRSCWGFMGRSIYDLVCNLLRRNTVEMWKCQNLSVENLHIEFQQNKSMVHWTHGKTEQFCLCCEKMRLIMGIYPTNLLKVRKAKYVFKYPEWLSLRATGWTIWPSNPYKNKKFVSAAKWNTISFLFQWVEGGLSHR